MDAVIKQEAKVGFDAVVKQSKAILAVAAILLFLSFLKVSFSGPYILCAVLAAVLYCVIITITWKRNSSFTGVIISNVVLIMGSNIARHFVPTNSSWMSLAEWMRGAQYYSIVIVVTEIYIIAFRSKIERDITSSEQR